MTDNSGSPSSDSRSGKASLFLDLIIGNVCLGSLFGTELVELLGHPLCHQPVWVEVLDDPAIGLADFIVRRVTAYAQDLVRAFFVGDRGREVCVFNALALLRRKSEFARALCGEPEILLMDEAFSALDPLIRSGMQDQLIELQRRLCKTVVFITHDLDEALKLGNRIAILKDGRLSQVGTPEEILLTPADDYVAAFVGDVNRARVLTVDTVLSAPAPRLESDGIEGARNEMRRRGVSRAFVFDGDGLVGAVTERDLAAARAGDGLRAAAKMPRTIPGDTLLEQALPAILRDEGPLGVADRDGRFLGVVSRQRLVRVLSGRDEAAEREPGGERGQ